MKSAPSTQRRSIRLRMLKLDDHLGLIETGYQADLTIYNDDYQILQTFVSGIPMLKQEETR